MIYAVINMQVWDRFLKIAVLLQGFKLCFTIDMNKQINILVISGFMSFCRQGSQTNLMLPLLFFMILTSLGEY